MSKLSVNFEEILTRARGYFEEQNTVLELSININNYYISNGGLLEECDKEQNMAVTVAAAASCLNRTLYNVLFNVTCWPSHRQTGTPTTNIQSALRTAPDLCKNV